jgi:two-component system response regulator RegA
VVEDDHTHCAVLQRAFERRGYAVKSAASVPQALVLLSDWSADYATIDLRLPGASGLALIPPLKEANPEIRIVMVTGYASVATAVEAIKLGAVHTWPSPLTRT